jgi:Uma2 family endonuclease
MGFPLRKADRIYTYGDYRSWPEDERWELIEGTAWNMSPAPGRFHQKISIEFSAIIRNFLRGKDCEVYAAPFDVLLPELGEEQEDEITTVVQPDISVICDKKKLTEKGCTGAPDFIIEILSPYTAMKDVDIKRRLYERHGVREYWIVDGGNKFIHVYVLGEEGKYPAEPAVYVSEDTVKSTVLEGLSIDLDELFQ